MPAPISPSLRRQIEKLSQQGETQTAIAQRLGLHRATVARHLAAYDAGNSLTAAEVGRLKLILAGIERSACPACGQPMVTLRSQSTGHCSDCKQPWQRNDVVSPSATHRQASVQRRP